MSEKRVAVKVENLTKSFRIPLEASSGIKQKIINLLKGKKGYRDFTPLKGVSFEINEGDFFGIIGRNGSGKSTLLKTLAGIYTPDGGTVAVNGKLVPFIELGVGFNPELSGKENVYLNGALLGFSHKEMEEMYEDIVDFAELHEFMEEKLKNYSSGMQVRLAFSIAIRAKGDILLLDEILAVGDEAFQRKCYSYFAQLKKEKKTVILVTHSMEAVQQFCNRAVLIDKEHKLVIGSPLEVAQIYRELNEPKDKNHINNPDKSKNQYFDVDAIYKNNNEGTLNFHFELTPKEAITEDDLVFTFAISKESGEMLYRFTSESLEEPLDFKLKNRIDMSIENVFPDGGYYVHVAVKKLDRTKNYALFDNVLQFELSNGLRNELWRPKNEYTINSK